MISYNQEIQKRIDILDFEFTNKKLNFCKIDFGNQFFNLIKEKDILAKSIAILDFAKDELEKIIEIINYGQ